MQIFRGDMGAGAMGAIAPVEFCGNWGQTNKKNVLILIGNYRTLNVEHINVILNNPEHTFLEEWLIPMNCSSYMAGSLVKSTPKVTRIH